MTVVNGIATFSDLRLNKLGIGYTLQASSAGLAAATTRGFRVVRLPILRLVVTAAHERRDGRQRVRPHRRGRRPVR